MTRETRNILQRWFIRGTLVLESPTHLSNGDSDPSVDLTIITDALDGRALLTGTSLAGALRHHLNERTEGYAYEYDERRQEMVFCEKPDSLAGFLFGVRREATEGWQSPLIVEDALGVEKSPRLELRDGVKIERKTRAAEDAHKFDVQLLAAGNRFNIGFELVISADMDLAQAKNGLAMILSGLENGEIYLGGRKRRGYGRCRATDWRVWQYDLTTREGLKGWLTHERNWPEETMEPRKGDHILPLLEVTAKELVDNRQQFSVTATLEIDGSLLIRSSFEEINGPDMVHLKSWREGAEDPVPVVSGTSLAGILRAQAFRIACTIGNEQKATQLVDNLFGYMAKPEDAGEVRQVSRVSVEETAITGAYRELVHTRVAIDRFTGGALESALFTEQPLFGGEVTVSFVVKKAPADNDRQQFNAEIGLLLLVLKDLWTGFVPIGGEASVGRGRLRGRTASLFDTTSQQRWEIKAAKNGLSVSEGDPALLENYIKVFTDRVEGLA